MHVSTFRRTVPLVASAALVTALTVGAFAAPVTAMPDPQKAEARAEAKAAREAAKQARADARAEAKAAREAAKQARAEARAEAKAARKAAREAAKQERSEKVTVCHKPGTPAEGTLQISLSALQAHLAHGDTEGTCATTASTTSTTCQEPDTSDTETSPVAGTEEDEATCDDSQQVVVSIDAPGSIDAQELLQLEGTVSGLDDDDLGFVWSSTCLTDEELTDPAIIASEPDSALLAILGGTLPAGTTCDFTLTVTDEAAGAAGSATVSVEVLALP